MDGADTCAVLGVARARRHSFTLPAETHLPALSLDLTVAPAPDTATADSPAIVLYVLDPEPILFGAVCLQCYAGAGYYASAAPDAPESSYRRLHVVGVGHRTADYGADARMWDGPRLRNLRRRHAEGQVSRKRLTRSFAQSPEHALSTQCAWSLTAERCVAQVYTKIRSSSFLVAVNPFRLVPGYDVDTMLKARAAGSELGPSPV